MDLLFDELFAALHAWNRARTKPLHTLVRLVRRAGEPDGTAKEMTADQWTLVLHGADEQMEAWGISVAQRSEVRAVYRELVRRGAISGPSWTPSTSQAHARMRLLPSTVIARVARTYGSDTRDPWTQSDRGRAWGDATRRESLLDFENPFGLPQTVDFFSCPLPRVSHGVDRAGFPRDVLRRESGRAGAAWRAGTIHANLDKLNAYLGWLESERHVDWSAHDLRTALEPEHLTAYLSAAGSGQITPDQARRAFLTLARIASPLFESKAIALGLDPDPFAEASRMCNSSSGYRTPGGQLRHRSFARLLASPSSLHSQRRTAIAIEDAWTRAMGTRNAWIGMRTAFEAARDAILRSLGCTSFEELRQLISRRVRFLSIDDAERLRDLQFVQDQLTCPLRSRTAVLVDRDMRWEDRGRILAAYPPSILKSPGNGPLRPCYSVGGEPSAYDAELYRLYVAPGGVRDQLLDGRPSDAFYVRALDPARFPTRNSGLTRIVRRVLVLGLRELDVDPKPLLRSGMVKNHAFRHAFAKHLCDQGMIQVAALYLHHADLNMIHRVYAAASAADWNMGGILAGGPTRATSSGPAVPEQRSQPLYLQ